MASAPEVPVTRFSRYDGNVRAPDLERITASVGGEPALFFEFFKDDYHVYGPRRPTADEVVVMVFDIYHAFDRASEDELVNFRLLLPKEDVKTEKPVSIYKLKDIVARTDDIQYMDITFRLGHVWADINAGNSARFGFATPFRLYDRWLGFLARLTPIRLFEENIADIREFLREHTSERYQHVQ